MDLEKFFDKVNHDKLMGLLARRIPDKRTLKLIRAYLTSGIMEEGVTSPRTEGTPQGSPLSPLLSNIVLHELDQELLKRKHRFVRYADDCSIYVKSEKSAHRVMENITGSIENKLKLKVNRTKSKVSKPVDSTLLGFSFYQRKGKWKIRIAPKSIERMRKKIKEHTRRNDPAPAKDKIGKIEPMIRGWVNYFAIADGKSKMKALDELVRKRLRIGTWHQWKRSKTRFLNLRKLGIEKPQAARWCNTRKGPCRIAQSQILHVTLNNNYFRKLKYIGFTNHYEWKTELQLKLF